MDDGARNDAARAVLADHNVDENNNNAAIYENQQPAYGEEDKPMELQTMINVVLHMSDEELEFALLNVELGAAPQDGNAIHDTNVFRVSCTIQIEPNSDVRIFVVYVSFVTTVYLRLEPIGGDFWTVFSLIEHRDEFYGNLDRNVTLSSQFVLNVNTIPPYPGWDRVIRRMVMTPVQLVRVPLEYGLLILDENWIIYPGPAVSRIFIDGGDDQDADDEGSLTGAERIVHDETDMEDESDSAWMRYTNRFLGNINQTNQNREEFICDVGRDLDDDDDDGSYHSDETIYPQRNTIDEFNAWWNVSHNFQTELSIPLYNLMGEWPDWTAHSEREIRSRLRLDPPRPSLLSLRHPENVVFPPPNYGLPRPNYGLPRPNPNMAALNGARYSQVPTNTRQVRFGQSLQQQTGNNNHSDRDAQRGIVIQFTPRESYNFQPSEDDDTLSDESDAMRLLNAGEDASSGDDSSSEANYLPPTAGIDREATTQALNRLSRIADNMRPLSFDPLGLRNCISRLLSGSNDFDAFAMRDQIPRHLLRDPIDMSSFRGWRRQRNLRLRPLNNNSLQAPTSNLIPELTENWTMEQTSPDVFTMRHASHQPFTFEVAPPTPESDSSKSEQQQPPRNIRRMFASDRNSFFEVVRRMGIIRSNSGVRRRRPAHNNSLRAASFIQLARRATSRRNIYDLLEHLLPLIDAHRSSFPVINSSTLARPHNDLGEVNASADVNTPQEGITIEEIADADCSADSGESNSSYEVNEEPMEQNIDDNSSLEQIAEEPPRVEPIAFVALNQQNFSDDVVSLGGASGDHMNLELESHLEPMPDDHWSSERSAEIESVYLKSIDGHSSEADEEITFHLSISESVVDEEPDSDVLMSSIPSSPRSSGDNRNEDWNHGYEADDENILEQDVDEPPVVLDLNSILPSITPQNSENADPLEINRRPFAAVETQPLEPIAEAPTEITQLAPQTTRPWVNFDEFDTSEEDECMEAEEPQRQPADIPQYLSRLFSTDSSGIAIPPPENNEATSPNVDALNTMLDGVDQQYPRFVQLLFEHAPRTPDELEATREYFRSRESDYVIPRRVWQPSQQAALCAPPANLILCTDRVYPPTRRLRRIRAITGGRRVSPSIESRRRVRPAALRSDNCISFGRRAYVAARCHATRFVRAMRNIITEEDELQDRQKKVVPLKTLLLQSEEEIAKLRAQLL